MENALAVLETRVAAVRQSLEPAYRPALEGLVAQLTPLSRTINAKISSVVHSLTQS